MFKSKFLVGWCRLHLVVIAVGIFGTAVTAAPPTWWNLPHPSNPAAPTMLDMPAVLNGNPLNNKGPVNIGQAKHMARSALLALRSYDQAAIADQIEAELVGPGRAISSWDPPANVNELEGQKAPVLLGQLKAIGHPFYNHLNAVASPWVLVQIQKNHGETAVSGIDFWQVMGDADYTEGGYFPWNPDTPLESNSSPVTIGQLKAVFSLRFESLDDYIPVGGTDTDGDGMPDDWEIIYGLDPSNSSDAILDLDDDGLLNLWEFINGTNPSTAPAERDSDSDTLPDDWENHYFGNLAQGANGDEDKDGLCNCKEYEHLSDPLDPDTDGDSMEDGFEVYYELAVNSGDNQIHPQNIGIGPDNDEDSDGETNKEEWESGGIPISSNEQPKFSYPPATLQWFGVAGKVYFVQWSSNLSTWNTLSQEYVGANQEINAFPTTGLFFRLHIYKVEEDSDSDGLPDWREIEKLNTNPDNQDTDGDQMADGWEVYYGFDPNDGNASNTSNTGPLDDKDFDGVSNLEEALTGRIPERSSDEPEFTFNPHELHWFGVSEIVYTLEWSTNLVDWNIYEEKLVGEDMEIVVSIEDVVGGPPPTTFFPRLRITSFLDHDLDGLSDGWELEHSLDLNSAVGADGGTGDLDGDGFSNLSEYHMGSLPDDSNSQPGGMVRAGAYHSLALTADGRVWSWGWNSDGQLGDRSETNKHKPTPVALVPGMARVVSIGAGESFSMALDENGVLWAWGNNDSHQVNSETTKNFDLPVRVQFPSLTQPITRFACGQTHCLAVDRQGNLWVWGSNIFGELGLGHDDSVTGPVMVPRLSGMGSIVDVGGADNSSYLLDVSGGIWAWGWNSNGQLGLGNYYGDYYTPQPVSMLGGTTVFKGLSTKHRHVLAHGSDGSIWSWGRFGSGGLGIGAGSNGYKESSPVQVTASPVTAQALGVGYAHSLAIDTNGDVWTWGKNSSGELGIGSLNPSSINVPIETSTVVDWSAVVAVDGGYYHSVALGQDGTVWTWGGGSNGQLGHGSSVSSQLDPKKVEDFKLASDDADGDQLADSWENHYDILSETGTDIGAGGVSNATAYLLGLNPQTGDADLDEMLDGWEIYYGLNPLDDRDALSDNDGDRIPNLWEFKHQTIPTNDPSDPSAGTNSKPETNWIVDPALVGTGSKYVTHIQDAINNAPWSSSDPAYYSVIEVAPGNYNEAIFISKDRRVVLLGALGSDRCEITNTTDYQNVIKIQGVAFIDGFGISRNYEGPNGEPDNPAKPRVYVAPGSGIRQASLSNMIIRNRQLRYSGKAVELSSGWLRIVHSTIHDAWSKTPGGAFTIGNGASLEIVNSIIHGDDAQDVPQINKSLAAIVNVSGSFVRNGEFGGNEADPLLDRDYGLMLGSPAIGAGIPLPAPLLDIHGEPRPLTAPDVGADQYLDTDSDTIPDWWEGKYGLSNSTDNRQTDLDNDGLFDSEEYDNGTDPNDTDSDDDLVSDYLEVRETFSDPTSWSDIALQDSDGDGLSNADEILIGSRLDLFDTNGDNVSDGVTYKLDPSLDPTSLDPDGDGLSTEQERALGTSPVKADTDGDGVSDDVDPDPLDPNVGLPSEEVGDVIGPQIILLAPTNAIEI